MTILLTVCCLVTWAMPRLADDPYAERSRADLIAPWALGASAVVLALTTVFSAAALALMSLPS